MTDLKKDAYLVTQTLKLKSKLIDKAKYEHRLQLLKKFDVVEVIRLIWRRISYGSKCTTQANEHIGKRDNEVLDLSGLRLCVYTCIVGSYDPVREPAVKEENIDYIVFTDQEVSSDSVWKKVDITNFPEYDIYGPYRFNRLLKMFPHKYLSNYDYSIYIDGSVIPSAYMMPVFEQMGSVGLGIHTHCERDCAYDEAVGAVWSKLTNADLIEKQFTEYEKQGFPRHYGLFENMVLVRKHSDLSVQKLMEQWWEEYSKYPTRDQPSLPVAMWKTDFDMKNICVLAHGFCSSGRFIRIEHEHNPKYRSDV